MITYASNLLNFRERMLLSDLFLWKYTMPSRKLLHIMRKNKSKEAEFEYYFETGTLLILLGIRLMR